MKVGVVIVTRNRSKEVRRCIESVLAQDPPADEIIIVDNDSQDDTSTIIPRDFPQVKYLRQSDNSGAAGGRNIGIHAASCDVCISLDDDARLLGTDVISRTRRYFEVESNLGALAMWIVDQHGKPIKKLIPRRDRKVVKDDTRVANFSGTGFAVRREFFVQLGGFWEKLNPYFGEEPDYCYRMVEHNYQVLLTPHIKVEHYESPHERPPERRLFCGTRNAPWMAMRSLPWLCVLSLTILSWGYFFLIACRYGHLRTYFSALRESVEGMPEVYRQRKPISYMSCFIIWRYSGLLFG